MKPSCLSANANLCSRPFYFSLLLFPLFLSLLVACADYPLEKDIEEDNENDGSEAEGSEKESDDEDEDTEMLMRELQRIKQERLQEQARKVMLLENKCKDERDRRGGNTSLH